MGKRINTARWIENKQHWRIDVQKDNIRKTFYSSIKGRNGQRECNKKADDWLDENIINSNIKVLKLKQSYVDEKKINVGTSRYKNILSVFNKWIDKYIGNKKVSNLTEQDLQDILNIMYKKGLSYKRIQEVKIIMCDFVKFARKNNITKLFPENLIVNKKAPKGTRDILQPNDIQKLFNIDKTIKYSKEIPDPFINLYRFIVLTGLRRGEALGLRWVDIRNDIIHSKHPINEYKEITKGKTELAERNVPLTPLAKEILKNIKKDSKYIFNTNDADIRPNYITERFKVYANYNKLAVHKIHKLRHTFVSLTDSELPINTLKSIVGHSKTMDTVSTYGHTVDGEMDTANKIINSKFSNILDGKYN